MCIVICYILAVVYSFVVCILFLYNIFSILKNFMQLGFIWNYIYSHILVLCGILYSYYRYILLLHYYIAAIKLYNNVDLAPHQLMCWAELFYILMLCPYCNTNYYTKLLDAKILSVVLMVDDVLLVFEDGIIAVRLFVEAINIHK